MALFEVGAEGAEAFGELVEDRDVGGRDRAAFRSANLLNLLRRKLGGAHGEQAGAGVKALEQLDGGGRQPPEIDFAPGVAREDNLVDYPAGVLQRHFLVRGHLVRELFDEDPRVGFTGLVVGPPPAPSALLRVLDV